MAKKRRNTRRKKQNGKLGGIVTALVCIAVILVLLVSGGQGSEFFSQIENALRQSFTPTDVQDKMNIETLVSLPENSGKLILFVVDTGNSDCIVIREPGGQTLLVDAADQDDFSHISNVLSVLQAETLTAALATHPDADHIGSMDDVIERHTPEVFYMTSFPKDTKTYTDMLAQLEQNNVAVVTGVAGMEFSLGQARITFLNPQDKDYDSANESSIVFLMEYGDTKFLLTGDIEDGALGDILTLYPELLDVDVLKIGHHGSAASTSQELIDLTTPEIAFITTGEDNDYGHPHSETVEILDANSVTTLRTDLLGDIVIFSDGQQITYKTAA